MDHLEQKKLVSQSSEAVPRFRARETVHGQFEKQVTHNPSRVAVRCGNEAISYRDLNAQANQLAHLLRKRGVEKGVPVGLYMEASVELIVAVLGILKAGGCYVPLMPENPSFRILQQLDETTTTIVITHRNVSSQLPKFRGEAICLDRNRAQITKESADDPKANVQAEDLVYIIYTSGSTGGPKGVTICHGSLVNYSHFICRLLKTDDHLNGMHFATLSTIAADLGNTAIFPALMSGGCLHVVPRETSMTPALLRAHVEKYPIDVLKITPSLLSALMGDVDASFLLPRKYLVLGGEACHWDLVKRIRRMGGCKIVNHYGPTEATVGCCTFVLPENDGEELSTTVPLGRPIDNAEVYILDNQLQPVPNGVSGELFIGGVGLSQGYVGKPRETAERFVPHPFADGASARLYRTGDLGCFLADGNIEFLGRIDDQVKIRGFRVEPNEIEAALLKHRYIAKAVVAACGSADQKLLTAYVVCTPSAQVHSGEVKRHLRELLPEYMVPSAVLILPELPLTPNGKVNRKTLPLPDFTSHSPQNVADSRSAVLTGLFAEILGFPTVSPEDSFFDVGGDSLRAIRLINRVRSALGVELSIRDVFEAPTASRLAKRVEQGMQPDPTPRPMARPPRIPLSFSQQGLWFLYRLEGPSATYNIPLALRMEGELNSSALESALNDVIQRHESLRTVFLDSAIGPQQMVVESDRVHVPFVQQDVSEADLQGVLSREAAYSFHLDKEIPIRAWLFRVTQQRHVLLVLLHHIAADAWSLIPLRRDLANAYAARLEGRLPGWLPLPLQYADYALWQHDQIGQQADSRTQTTNRQAYWQNALVGIPEELDLPRDRPRSAANGYQGQKCSFELPAHMRQKLLYLASACGASLFMVLQAGLVSLFTRLGAGVDIVLGTPVAGRMHDSLDDLVGFFVNTLVLRTDSSGNPSFLELIGRIKENNLNAYAHQEFPFERIVDALNPRRSLARHPLFQVSIAFQNNDERESGLPGLTWTSQLIYTHTSKFDLTFSFQSQRSDGDRCTLQLDIEYSTSLFDRSTAETLGARLLRILEVGADNPEAPISRLDIFVQAERHKTLKVWNNTQHRWPEATLPSLFEAQAIKSPQSPAVVSDGKTLTYRQLDLQTNQLAHYLRKRGVRPEVRVGICIERSAEFLVAVLAVLKAGGAYVPLDPEYPTERLTFMVRDAGVAMLLRVTRVGEELAREVREELCLDNDYSRIAEESVDPVPSQLEQDNAAYVIYTSGSTGVPKGVVCTHHGLTNYLLWALKHYAVTFLGAPVHSSVSFDLTISALFLPLLSGGPVVLVRKENGVEILSKILASGEEFDLVKVTPSHLDALSFSLHGREKAVKVRVLVVGGERLAYEQLASWRKYSPQSRVVNEYGPTETVVGCVTFDASREAQAIKGVPIGKPIANTRVYILDSDYQPMPIGVSGELYIGGAGLARGYINRPDLTAERFTPDPFSEESGARLYRTGDFVRWRADGEMEFLGRADDQLKIRGYRIEPGEIESVLRERVSEAVVVAREDHPGDQRLVAYVVANKESEISGEELDVFLKERLPAYMIPSSFVLLPSLPLTTAGKVDRRSLPAPGKAGPVGSFVAPRTPTEKRLAHIFAEALGLDRVGIDDNFFNLGGHSLLLIRVIARVRDVFNVEIPTRVFFEQPTVSCVAHFVATSCGIEPSVHPRIIPTLPRRGVLPLSPGEEFIWLLSHLSPDYIGLRGFLGRRLTGRLDISALTQSVNDIVQRHEVLRTTYCRKGLRGYLQQFLMQSARSLSSKEPRPSSPFLDQLTAVASRMSKNKILVAGLDRLASVLWASIRPSRLILPSLQVPLLTVDLQNIPVGEREAHAMRLAMEERDRGFDLAKGPLVRMKLLRMGQNDHIFLLTLHHIVCDAWSMGILAKELQYYYGSHYRQMVPDLTALPIQYADYAAWRRAQVEGGAYQELVRYWQNRLQGMPGALPSVDYAQPVEPTLPSAVYNFVIDARQTESLRRFSQSEGVTLFIILLTIFEMLLYRLCGLEDVAVAVVLAERGRSELENLVGFFVSFVVVRITLDGSSSFVDLLKQVQKTSLDAFTHAEPSAILEAVARELGLYEFVRLRGATFKTIFNWINVPSADLEFPDMQTELFVPPQKVAQVGCDIFFQGREKNGGIAFSIIYKEPLFPRDWMANFARHFQDLVSQVVETPKKSISAYSLHETDDGEYFEHGAAVT